jgi:TFIIF-interacting CTD phosphatase-like protein
MLTQFSLNGKKATSYVRKRFGAEYFISEMSKIYELVLFTAATKEYAEKVIDVIDAKKRI